MRRLDFLRSIGLMAGGLSFAGFSFARVTDSPKLRPLLVDDKGRPIKSLKKWRRQSAIIRERWASYLGIIKPNNNTPELEVLAEDHPEGMVRQLVRYEGEPGIAVKGYLIKPASISRPLPAVVAMHSTSDRQMEYIAGVKTGKIVPFAYRLAQQGFVVFCPQCFLMQDDVGYDALVSRFKLRHPQSKGMAKMLFDAQRAVDVLTSMKEVDTDRIGAMGHSLGAKEVFYLGAFDDRVKSIVSNEGGIGIGFSNWDAPWYLGEEIREFPYAHHELLALVAPKPFLLIGGDSADGEQSRPYIDAVSPVYELYDKPSNIVLFNHGKGHSVPPEAELQTYMWLKETL